MNRLYFLAAAISFSTGMIFAFNGCTTFNANSSGNLSTNAVSISIAPVYHVKTPTLETLAGTYHSQDAKFRNSAIRIFPSGEFVWNSRTYEVQIFRGHIYDLNDDGFSVKLSDGSGDSFHFQFTPDKRGFWSVDEYGTQVEEYLP